VDIVHHKQLRHQARNRTHILTLLMKVTATRQFEQSLLDRGVPAPWSRCGRASRRNPAIAVRRSNALTLYRI
jgi:hypothetical protein